MKGLSLHLAAVKRGPFVVPMLSHDLRDSNFGAAHESAKPLTPRSIEALPAALTGKRVLVWDGAKPRAKPRAGEELESSVVSMTHFYGPVLSMLTVVFVFGVMALARRS